MMAVNRGMTGDGREPPSGARGGAVAPLLVSRSTPREAGHVVPRPSSDPAHLALRPAG